MNPIEAAVRSTNEVYKAGMNAHRELLIFVEDKACEIKTWCDHPEHVLKMAEEIRRRVAAVLGE